MSKTIPKIIHREWLDSHDCCNDGPPLKYKLRGYWQSWPIHNPDFEFQFWNHRKVNMLMEIPELSKYRNFYKTKLTRLIEKCDFSRYCIMYMIGGIYVDLDFRCLSNFSSLIEGKEIQLFFEGDEHWNPGDPVHPRLYNGMLMSVKGHPFWLEWMDYLMEKYDPKRGVFMNTGPMRFSMFVQEKKIYQKHPEWFGNKCLVLPFIGQGRITKECLDYFNKPDGSKLTLEEQDLRRYHPSKINDAPYNKMASFTLWKDGTGWGKEKVDQIHKQGIEPLIQSVTQSIEEEKRNQLPKHFANFTVKEKLDQQKSLSQNQTIIVVTIVTVVSVLFIATVILVLVSLKNRKKL